MKRNKGTNSSSRNSLTNSEREIIQSRAGLEVKGGKVVLDKNYRLHPNACACNTCAIPGFWNDWLSSAKAYFQATAECKYKEIKGELQHDDACRNEDDTSCGQFAKASSWVFAYLAENYPEEFALYKLMRTAKLRRAYNNGEFDILHDAYNDMIIKNYQIAFKSQDNRRKSYSSTSKGFKMNSQFSELKKLKLA